MYRRFSALVLLMAISACAPFPEVAAQSPDTGPPPPLLPIDALLAQAEPGPQAAPAP
jgi:hypothetical protein